MSCYQAIFHSIQGYHHINEKGVRLRFDMAPITLQLIKKPAFPSPSPIHIRTSLVTLDFPFPLPFKSRGGQQFATILVDFYIQLRTILEQINLDSFQRFRLRAGLNQAYFSSPTSVVHVHVYHGFECWDANILFVTNFFGKRFFQRFLNI